MQKPVEENKRIVISCPSCGAAHDAALEKCPYCGHVNERADERGFYNDLKGEKDAVSAMVDIPEAAATKEAKHAGRLIITALVALAIIVGVFFAITRITETNRTERDEEAIYLWMQESAPKLQEAYDKGMASSDDPAQKDFSDLIELYMQESRNGAPVYYFDHYNFASQLCTIYGMDDELESADNVDGNGERYKSHAETIFYYEMTMYLIPENKSLSDDEKAVLQARAVPYIEDMKVRFSMTEDELETFRSNYIKDGYLRYTDCEEFVNGRIK